MFVDEWHGGVFELGICRDCKSRAHVSSCCIEPFNGEGWRHAVAPYVNSDALSGLWRQLESHIGLRASQHDVLKPVSKFIKVALAIEVPDSLVRGYLLLGCAAISETEREEVGPEAAGDDGVENAPKVAGPVRHRRSTEAPNIRSVLGDLFGRLRAFGLWIHEVVALVEDDDFGGPLGKLVRPRMQDVVMANDEVEGVEWRVFGFETFAFVDR